MERVSLDDVRLLRTMIDEHQSELLKERARLEALRLEWSRMTVITSRLQEAGEARQATQRQHVAQSLRGQITESEQKIARIEELISILRRKQHAL